MDENDITFVDNNSELLFPEIFDGPLTMDYFWGYEQVIPKIDYFVHIPVEIPVGRESCI
jgi:hypothetical protein